MNASQNDIDAIILVIASNREVSPMPNLIVRNIDERIVKALKARAGKHGHSAEAEHRQILATALLKHRKKSFAEVLSSIPEVGVDADFARQQTEAANDVFN
jgi:antitoxin FitA